MSISVLGINLKKIRLQKNLSAYKLSKLASVGTTTISEIESGVRQNLTSSTIEKLATALNVSPDQFFTIDSSEEYIVTDLSETLNFILTSDELTLDNIPLSLQEKKQLKVIFTSAIDILKIQRTKKETTTLTP